MSALSEISSELSIITRDYIKALSLWRIWWSIGLQDMKKQFNRSKLGLYWIFINLTLMAAGVGFVYGRLFHIDIKTFMPLLVIGLVVWFFIIATFTTSCSTFIIAEGYIKQFSLPKQIYILRSMINYMVTFFFGFLVYVLVAIFFHVPVGLGTLYVIPGIIILFAISLGVASGLAYLGAGVRDLAPALAGLFQILFYITPIIYTPEMIAKRGLAFIYLYNPLYYLVELVRYPLLHNAPAPSYVYIVSLIFVVSAWLVAFLVMVLLDKKVVNFL